MEGFNREDLNIQMNFGLIYCLSCSPSQVINSRVSLGFKGVEEILQFTFTPEGNLIMFCLLGLIFIQFFPKT